NADQPAGADRQLLASQPRGQPGTRPVERHEVGEGLRQLEVSHVDGPGGGLAGVFPVAAELHERPEPSPDVEVARGEDAGRERGERRFDREAEECRVMAFDALAELPRPGQVGGSRLVQWEELQAFEQGRLRLVPQEAVVLPPPDHVELAPDGSRLLAGREPGRQRVKEDRDEDGLALHGWSAGGGSWTVRASIIAQQSSL